VLGGTWLPIMPWRAELRNLSQSGSIELHRARSAPGSKRGEVQDRIRSSQEVPSDSDSDDGLRGRYELDTGRRDRIATTGIRPLINADAAQYRVTLRPRPLRP